MIDYYAGDIGSKNNKKILASMPTNLHCTGQSTQKAISKIQ